MLQTGKSRVRSQMRSIFFSVYLILPAAIGLGFTQPLTEISTRNLKILFLWSKVRRVRRADKLAAIYESIV
jgi:hypothetical protein